MELNSSLQQTDEKTVESHTVSVAVFILAPRLVVAHIPSLVVPAVSAALIHLLSVRSIGLSRLIISLLPFVSAVLLGFLTPSLHSSIEALIPALLKLLSIYVLVTLFAPLSLALDIALLMTL